MATDGTEEVPKAAPTEDSLEEKLGELKIKDLTPAAEEPEKFEDSTDAPVEGSVEEAHENVVDELKSGLPELQHVETKDTTDPDTGDSTEGGVVKAEVPEAFKEELKADHDIVPETPAAVETVSKDVGAEDGKSVPATRDVPVTVTHENVDTKPAKGVSIGDKITETFHKIVGGKEASS